jgi:hypothetical protein
MLHDEGGTNRFKVYAWDEASDEKLITYRKMGYTYKRIAEIMEVPSESVVRRRFEKITPLLGERPPPPSRPFTDQEREQFTKLYTDGLSMNEIAERMGRTKNAMCGLRSRLNLPKRGSIAVAGQPNLYATRISKTWQKMRRADGKPRAPKIAKDPVDLRAAEQRIKEAADVGFHNGGLTFAQLTPTCCRFIKGEVQDPAHRYCGSKVVEGKSWCRHHYGVVFRDVR